MRSPFDIATVYDGILKRWLMYYVDDYPKWFDGPGDSVREEDFKGSYAPNEPTKLPDNCPKAHPKNKQVAVTEYVYPNGSQQTRIYYLDADLNLVELGYNGDRKDGDKWFLGALTFSQPRITVSPSSPISAVYSGGQHKVYFRGADSDAGQEQMFVAYAKPDENWTSKPIIQF